MSKRFNLRRLQSQIGMKISADRLCRIWSGEHGAWWRANSQGMTIHAEASGFYPVSEAIAIAVGMGPEKRLSFDVCWDYPIIFSAPMILALIAGRKIMTRRYAWSEVNLDKPLPKRARRIGLGGKFCDVVPTIWQEVAPGDTLWVRENFRVGSRHDAVKPRDLTPKTMTVAFAAGGSMANHENGWSHDPSYPARPEDATFLGKLRPAIYLPRWSSRLTLDVTANKTERLQAVTEIDARAEGITQCDNGRDWWDGTQHSTAASTAKGAFYCLWSGLHGEQSWNDDPQLCAMSFSVQKRNIDAAHDRPM